MQRAAPPTPAARPPLTPVPQSPTVQQPPVAYGTRPQYNGTKYNPPPPGFGQRQNYSSPGVMPQGGIPIPRAVPSAASAAPMPGSPPLPASPYPYQAVPPVPRGGGISETGKRGLIRIITTLVIIIVCFFIGSGIYYFVTQNGTPSQPSSTADVTPPSIQISTTSTTETGATITWQTDEPATSQVEYGETETYGSSTTPDTSLSTTHTVALTGLNPNTTYYFEVMSKDAAGNQAIVKGNLTTLATADTTPPTISGVNVNITESSAIITWMTDELATSQVNYGKTETYGSSTTPDTNLTTSHNVTLTGLSDNTTYYFKVISKDASGNEATLAAENQTFTTKSIIPVGYEEGNRAPEFSLNDINGNVWKLSDFKGKIVMVNFWATWCGPCTEEMPFFQAISDNQTILAINKAEGTTTVRSFINGKGYTFTVLLDNDPQGEVSTLYGITEIPTTFFIDANGIIRKIEGPFSSQTEIKTILDSL